MPRRASVVGHRRHAARVLCRTVVVALLACMLGGASAMSGMPYVWCVPMARVQLGPCCASHAARGDDRSRPRADATDCCESHRVGTLPAATPSFAVAPLAPPILIALVRFVAVVASTPIVTTSPRIATQPRAGPEPPLFALHRAYLI